MYTDAQLMAKLYLKYMNTNCFWKMFEVNNLKIKEQRRHSTHFLTNGYHIKIRLKKKTNKPTTGHGS